MITLYGIKTCGSVRKAIALLEKHSIPFNFVDLKTHSLNNALITSWREKKGIKIVLNTKGTTYKNLKKEGVIVDSTLKTLSKQIALLTQYPLLLKRPIITYENELIIGYDEARIIALVQSYQNHKF